MLAADRRELFLELVTADPLRAKPTRAQRGRMQRMRRLVDEQVRSQMTDKSRRAFLAPVAVELVLCLPERQNAPSLRWVVKNYMD